MTVLFQKFAKNFTLALALSVCVLGLSSCAQKTPTQEKTEQAQKQADENTQVLQSIGKLMVIPNEEPIVATLAEAEKLRAEQPFYSWVENGDKLVIFPKTHKAVIYRPSKNLIINSGPFELDPDAVKAKIEPKKSPK